MFDKKNITILIQGPWHEEITSKVISSAKLYFPQSPILVSTCDNISSSHAKDNCRFIISPDPGAFCYPNHPYEKPNNINRQLVNTINGLKEVKTRYTLKLRSDFILMGNSFLNFYDRFLPADPEFQIFEHKILSCCYFARNPNSKMCFPYHISDLVLFGQTKDLRNLFDIPLMNTNDAYFDPTGKHPYRLIPEQYIFINCLKKNGKKAELELYNRTTPENIEDTERYFASNFVLLSFEQFNLQYTKKTFDMAIHPNSFITCYTHYDWLKLYKKWVNPAVELPERDEERDKLNKFYKTYRKYRFFANIIALPFRTKEKRKKVRNGILEYFLERKYK